MVIPKLSLPPEPVKIKETARKKAESNEWSFIPRHKVYNLFLLSAQNIPKYLWNYWKPGLEVMGIRWQLFQRIISGCENDVRSWAEGAISWEDLVERIINELKSEDC